jgi:hypothetical protein
MFGGENMNIANQNWMKIRDNGSIFDFSWISGRMH